MPPTETPSSGAIDPTSSGGQLLPRKAVSVPISATTSSREVPSVSPSANNIARPVVASTSEIVQNTSLPQALPQENNFSMEALIILGSTILLGIAAIAKIFKKETKEKNTTNNTQEDENSNRCFDVKKLMEEKAKEFTDLEGQLRQMVSQKIEDKAKEAIRGTVAGDILAEVEKTKNEYEKLKKLYERCIIEIHAPKRVFVVHGWGGNPEKNWFPWLKQELEKNDFQVFVPQLPDTENPRIATWVPALAKIVGTPDRNTFFVGHSMGCQTIARYLAALPEDVIVGGVSFVAGFFKRLTNLEDDKATRETKDHWLTAPIDFEKVKKHTLKSVAIFSDDDPYVPLDNQDDFRTKLDAKIIVERGKGHFNDEGPKVKELPVVFESIISFLKK